MGIDFRSAGYVRRIWCGGRTIKDGEAAAIWNIRGEHRQVIGPSREHMMFSTIRFLKRYKAESHQYLEVHHRDGRVQHIRGPAQIFENPALHDNVSVQEAIHLDSPQKCIIVYRETTAVATALDATSADETVRSDGKESKCAEEEIEKKTPICGQAAHNSEGDISVLKHVVQGPAMYVPQVGEWLHAWTWSGKAMPAASSSSIVSNKHKFRILHTDTSRAWNITLPLNSQDGKTFGIGLTIMYHIESNIDNINKLIAVVDPIAAMWSSINSDCTQLGSTWSSIQLRADSSELNAIKKTLVSNDSYPLLMQTTSSSGITIDDIRLTHLSPPADMVHQIAAEQKELSKLRNTMGRLADERCKVREMEEAERKRKLQVDAKMRREELQLEKQFEAERQEFRETQLENQLKLKATRRRAEMATREEDRKPLIQFLQELKHQDVDMTKFMCSVGGIALSLPILSNAPKHLNGTLPYELPQPYEVQWPKDPNSGLGSEESKLSSDLCVKKKKQNTDMSL